MVLYSYVSAILIFIQAFLQLCIYAFVCLRICLNLNLNTITAVKSTRDITPTCLFPGGMGRGDRLPQRKTWGCSSYLLGFKVRGLAIF